MKMTKKNLYIYSGVGLVAIVLLVFFGVMMAGGGDKKPEQEIAIQPTTQPVIADPQLTEEPNNDSINSSDNTGTITAGTDTENQPTAPVPAALQSAPYTRVFFDGKTHIVNSGDLVIDSEGNLLIKASYLSGGLNLPISWEGDTVFVGLQPVPETTTNEVAQFISDLDYLKFYSSGDNLQKMELAKDQWTKETYFRVAGKEYNKGLGFSLNYGWGTGQNVELDYNLAGNYKTFKTVIGVDDQMKNTKATYIVRLYGDDKKIAETKEFTGGDFAIPIEADLTGVIRLTIEIAQVATDGNYNEVGIVLANARISK
ncbi:NPCBM/NEW2 domain-containing protein [Paenibacillus luteus]|uniref:NPCBM/NEW2 domain-containing protein n=1 Tax=Paenibacillus luteus TaxID=2545753 RepID=UPI0011446E32|nr:NPCBM/NEW2 domain-containing protein [Paenibacillus luteus]